MRKKLLTQLYAIFMILTLFYGTLLNVQAEPIEAEKPEDPKLIIARDVKMPVFKAGEKVELKIPIYNLNEGQAKDVIVSPVIDDPNNFPFEFEEISLKKQVLFIGRRTQKDIVFNLRVKPNAEAKVHAIRFNVEYGNLYGSSFNFSDIVNIKIENDLKPPSLKLFRMAIEGGELSSGSTRTVDLHLENTGDLTARNIEARLSGFTNDGLTLGGVTDTQEIKILKAKFQDKVSFKIKADPDLGSGTQSLDLSLSYRDEYNKEYKTETKVYLPVNGYGEGNMDFTFENLTYPQNAVDIGTDFKISFDLKNIGEVEAKGIKVSVDGGGEILPKSAPIKNIKNLAAGESRNVEFVLFPKDGIESKNYSIKLNVEYGGKDGKSAGQTISQYVGVLVNGVGAKGGTPKIIIDDYDFNGEFVKAGETFPLNISFFNTNRGSAVRNIKVSLSSDDDIFSPVDSSNSFYIGEIAPNGRVQKTLLLKPKNDASYKTYNISAEIEYEDGKGDKLTAKETMGIPVVQEIKLLISDAEIPPENFVGNATGISMDFYNVGRSLIRNLMIRTEGDFEVRDGNMYVGNLEAGKDNYYDVTVVPNKPGDLAGKIIFEYDNELGEHFIVEKDFSLTVMEQIAPPMPEGPMEMEQPPKKMTAKKWVLLAGAAAVAGGGFIVYKKRKKKLEEVTIDE